MFFVSHQANGVLPRVNFDRNTLFLLTNLSTLFMTISMPSSLTSSLSNICASILLPPGILRDQNMHFGQQSGLNDELEVITKNILLR